MPKVSCLVFHVLLICLLPLMCLFSHVWVSSMLCSVTIAFSLRLRLPCRCLLLYLSESSVCSNRLCVSCLYLLKMNLNPQTVFSSKAFYIVCVLPACVVHYGIMQGWWTASVSLPVLSSQLGEMRDCLMHWRTLLSQTSATVMELRSPHWFSLKQHEAQQCTDTGKNQRTLQREPCWGPCNLSILL